MSETQNPPNQSESDPDPSPSPSPNPSTRQPSNPRVAASKSNKTHKRRRDHSNYNNNNNSRTGRSDDYRHPKRGRVKSSTTSHNINNNEVIYRIVVPAWQIGKVIGRGGSRIQFIRDETRATIKIADAISRHEERVIIISSKSGDNLFSDAEKALHQIVNLILLDDGTKDPGQVGAGHVAPNAVRLLIAGSQAGALIGVSGQNIENLRNSSGATITVLSPNQMPSCASAHESDRVAQVSGDVPAVLRAVVEIGCQMRVNPPKQVISVNPAHNVSFHPNHPQPQYYVEHAQHYVDPPLAEHVTLDLMVPEKLVGGLIGRFGANISRIRNESGANIKVHGGRGEQTERKIHLSGTAQQVNLASRRVDEYVHAELMRQSGGQLPPTAGIAQQVVSQPPIRLEIPNPSYQGYGPQHPPPAPHPYPYPYPYPHPDPHPQPQSEGLYANSSYEAAMMAPPPPPPLSYAPAPLQQPHLTYAPAPVQQPQPPSYYEYQQYPHYAAPPL